MPFGNNLVENFNPKSFFPIKICHIMFDTIFDSSKHMMLGIERIKVCRVIPGSWDPVHLPNPTITSRLVVASSFISGLYRELLFHMVNEQH